MTEVSGDEVRQITCARLTLTNLQPFRPKLDFPAIAFAGHFHLGGANGLFLTNAQLTLINPDNIFDPSPTAPFGVRVGGTIKIPAGPSSALTDAQLLTTNIHTLPRFTVRGMGYNESEFTLAQHLPARVSAASFEFIQPTLPLRQLLHPTNVNFTFSAVVSVPSSETKVFEGSVDKLKINIKQNGKPEIKDVDGFSILMKGLNLPPLNQLGGVLNVTGLSSGNSGGGTRNAAPAGLFGGDINDLFLGGSLEGDYQGYRVKVIVALRPSGSRDTNNSGGRTLARLAGPASLPTGNPSGEGPFPVPPGKADTSDANGLPFDPGLITMGLPHARYTNEFGLPCPGDCPPPTINLFCQPHPDAQRFPRRVIARFSSIDEPTLNRLGFTRAWVRGRFAAGND